MVNQKFLNYSFALYTILPFLITPNIAASEIISRRNITSYTNYKDEYILGPGDILEIKFMGLTLFDDNYAINPDGMLNLPEVGKIFAKGKTSEELIEILEEKYSEFLYNPKIKFSIISYRPLLITLRGEVNKTGLFSLSYTSRSIPNSKLKNINGTNIFSNQITRLGTDKAQDAPKLFDLLKLGEGITSYADLTNVQIIRRNSDGNGGGFLKTQVNLMSLLESGDQSVNIDLRDGDNVLVPKSKKILLDQLIEINKSNLTPDSVKVYVNGNVPRPGMIDIKQGSSLREAISAAGGAKSMSGNIEFIRLSKKGKTEKRIFRLNNSIKGTTTNPILISGDIIHVRKNLFNQASSVINEYTSPLVNAYGIYKIFE